MVNISMLSAYRADAMVYTCHLSKATSGILHDRVAMVVNENQLAFVLKLDDHHVRGMFCYLCSPLKIDVFVLLVVPVSIVTPIRYCDFS